MAINLVYQPDAAAGENVALAAGQGQYDLVQQQRALQEQQLAQQAQQIENQNRQAAAELQLRQYLGRLQNAQNYAAMQQRGYLAERELAQREAAAQLQSQTAMQELMARAYEGEQNRLTQRDLEEMQQSGWDENRAMQERLAKQKLVADEQAASLQFDRDLQRDASIWERNKATAEMTAIRQDILDGRLSPVEGQKAMDAWEANHPNMGTFPFRDTKPKYQPQLENATAFAKARLGTEYYDGAEAIGFHKNQDGDWEPNGTWAEVNNAYNAHFDAQLAKEKLQIEREQAKQQQVEKIVTAENKAAVDAAKALRDYKEKVILESLKITTVPVGRRPSSDPKLVAAAQQKFRDDALKAYQQMVQEEGSSGNTNASYPSYATEGDALANMKKGDIAYVAGQLIERYGDGPNDFRYYTGQ